MNPEQLSKSAERLDSHAAIVEAYDKKRKLLEARVEKRLEPFADLSRRNETVFSNANTLLRAATPIEAGKSAVRACVVLDGMFGERGRAMPVITQISRLDGGDYSGISFEFFRAKNLAFVQSVANNPSKYRLTKEMAIDTEAMDDTYERSYYISADGDYDEIEKLGQDHVTHSRFPIFSGPGLARAQKTIDINLSRLEGTMRMTEISAHNAELNPVIAENLATIAQRDGLREAA